MLRSTLPKSILNIYDRITDTATPQYIVDMKFILEDGTVFPMDSQYINSIQIDHKFHENIIPKHTASIAIPLEAVPVLITHHQNLHMSLDVYLVAPTKERLVKTISETFYVIIQNLPDVQTFLSEMPAVTLEPSADTKLMVVDMELETQVNYDFHKTRCSIILRDATVEDALYVMAGTFGWNNTWIEKPDNDKTYKCIVLSPNKSFADMCNTLQSSEAYDGIYAGGCSCYVMNNTMYVLPEFTVSSYTKEALFITVSNHDDDPSDGTTLYENETIKAIVYDPVQTVSDFKMAAEDSNALQVIDPVKILDTPIPSDEVGMFIPNTSELVTLMDVGGVNSDGFTHTVAKSRNSLNAEYRLKLNTLSESTMIWRNAVPNSILPHMKISQIIHTRNGDVVNKQGVPKEVNYLLSRNEGIEKCPTFSCMSTVVLITSIT